MPNKLDVIKQMLLNLCIWIIFITLFEVICNPIQSMLDLVNAFILFYAVMYVHNETMVAFDSKPPTPPTDKSDDDLKAA